MLEKLLLLLQSGTKLGWLIDPDDCWVVVAVPRQEVRIYRDDQILPTLAEIDRQLSTATILPWLSS